MGAMHQDVRCSSCSAQLPRAADLFCFSCLQKYASPRWTACCRCGDTRCFATCGELDWLASVDSLFPYVGRHRGLLLAAKDLQDSVSIALFNAAYVHVAVQRLVEMLTAKSYWFILLARMRVPRLASQQWHPNDFWLHCLRLAQQHMRQLYPMDAPVPVLMRPSLTFQKRAKISSKARRERLSSSRADFHSDPPEDYLERPVRNVLVLDDVLTSGGSLWKEWTDLQETGQADEHVLLHALTLFRTPSATKNHPKDVS